MSELPPPPLRTPRIADLPGRGTFQGVGGRSRGEGEVPVIWLNFPLPHGTSPSPTQMHAFQGGVPGGIRCTNMGQEWVTGNWGETPTGVENQRSTESPLNALSILSCNRGATMSGPPRGPFTVYIRASTYIYVYTSICVCGRGVSTWNSVYQYGPWNLARFVHNMRVGCFIRI